MLQNVCRLTHVLFVLRKAHLHFALQLCHLSPCLFQLGLRIADGRALDGDGAGCLRLRRRQIHDLAGMTSV